MIDEKNTKMYYYILVQFFFSAGYSSITRISGVIKFMRAKFH